MSQPLQARDNFSAQGLHGLSDNHLIAAARAGALDAYAALCERYRCRIDATIRKVAPQREDREDALQDAMMRAFIHLHRFDERSTFATWLTRIALNSSLMAIRKSKPAKTVAIDDLSAGKDRPFEPEEHSLSPEAALIRKRERQAVHRAIRNLPPKMRVVVEMRHLQDRSVTDTARLLGISVPAAKSRLLRARSFLRESVDCGSPAGSPRRRSGARSRA